MTLDEKTVKVPKMIDETTHTVPISKDTTGYDMEIKEEGSYYILIPFGVFLFIIILSLLVYMMVRNRRGIEHIYCKKRQGKRYFDDGYDSPLQQDAFHEDEGEADNDDNPTKSLLRGKLQINSRYENYLSTSHLNKSSELFT